MAYKVGTQNAVDLMAVEAIGDGAGEAVGTNNKKWQDVYKNSGFDATNNKIMSFKPDVPFAKDADGISTELIIPYKVGGLRIAKKGYRPNNLTELASLNGGTIASDSRTNWAVKYVQTINSVLSMASNSDMSTNATVLDKTHNIHMLYVELQGGGAGGGSQTNGPNGSGGGGGAGGFVCGYLPLIEEVVYALRAGYGGNGSSSNSNSGGWNGSYSEIVRTDTDETLYRADNGSFGLSNHSGSSAGGAGGSGNIVLDGFELGDYPGGNGGSGGSNSNNGASGGDVTSKVINTGVESNKTYSAHKGGFFGNNGNHQYQGGGGGASAFADGGDGGGGFTADISGISFPINAASGNLGSGGAGGSGFIINLGLTTSHYKGAAGGAGFIKLYY